MGGGLHKGCCCGPTCVPRIPLGFGLVADAFPGHTIDVAQGSHASLPDETAVWKRISAEMTGAPLGGSYGHNPAGLAGEWTLQNWVATTELPFFVRKPQRTIGSFREVPGVLPLGEMVVDLSGLAPTDGVWFGSCLFPFVIQSRFFRPPGPWHHEDANGLLWTGLGPSDFPLDVATSKQLFANYNAWLTLEPLEGGATLTLWVKLYLVAVMGRQMDFDWSVPVEITGTDIDCSADGILEGSVGTACAAAWEDTGLGEIGCYCTCEDSQWQMPVCHLLEVSNNNIRQGVGPDLPYPACDTQHKNYITEVYLTGQKRVGYELNWPEGNNPSSVTAALVLARFSTHPDLVADGPFFELHRLVAAAFESSRFGNLAFDTHAQSQDRTKSIVSFGATPSGPMPPQGFGSTYVGDQGTPLPAPGSVPDAIPYCAPMLSRVYVAGVAGYEAWLLNQFRNMEKDLDPYWAGKDPDETSRTYDAIQGDPFVDSEAKIHCVTGQRSGYRFACGMWAYWLGTASLRAALADGRNTTHHTNVPLLTECYNNNPGIPDGVDPDTHEGVYGILGPYSDPVACPSINAWKRTGGICQPHAAWGHYTTNINECNSFGPYISAMLKCPSMPDNDGDWPDVCWYDCWRLLASGGYSSPTGPVDAYKPCSLYPEQSWCWDEPENEAESCDWIGDGARLHHESTGSGWPKYWIFKRPYLEVRIKIENCKLKVRAHYMTWVIREARLWYTDSWPDVENGSWDPGDEGFPGTNWPWPPMFMGYLEVGRGASFEAPIGVTSPLGGQLTHDLWSRVQSESILLGGCGGDPAPVIQVEGDGNTLGIEL